MDVPCLKKFVKTSLSLALLCCLGCSGSDPVPSSQGKTTPTKPKSRFSLIHSHEARHPEQPLEMSCAYFYAHRKEEDNPHFRYVGKAFVLLSKGGPERRPIYRRTALQQPDNGVPPFLACTYSSEPGPDATLLGYVFKEQEKGTRKLQLTYAKTAQAAQALAFGGKGGYEEKGHVLGYAYPADHQEDGSLMDHP